ncbi:glycosyltransferase family 2 protein [candidate division WWE3 bacterium]|uniref:Glycosyltransferase family 2 protein n=1 Tax=candidate division WWE3 bacterium TaxID=2053526 RepID=A0A7X9HH19_UNCKA|nr:glycosyltransferase family 2 protein [candidate division WWE3 bacterium]
MSLPKISFVIPTLNASKVLQACLDSIAMQDYPGDLIEIIIADGGSKDNTLNIARFFKAKIVENPLKTGEAGKSAGVKATTGEYIALVDSDNVLSDTSWLRRMVEPLLANPQALGSEPWGFTYRPKDGFIDRYCALLGMNDPICLFIGNYDRYSILTGKWTNVPHEEQDMGDYLLVKFNKQGIPTIGANGTVFRADFLKTADTNDYLFDIDILAQVIQEQGSVTFIKVKNSIAHTYSGSNIGKFVRKQRRRINDLMYFRQIGTRKYDWGYQSNGISLFIISTILTIPLYVQSIIGFVKKPDFAWFFHPFACWIGLIINTYGVILAGGTAKVENRSGWSQ